jgi:serine/threonine-protein kinase
MSRAPDDLAPERAALEAALAGRFVLERELGRGGMGIVYLGREVALERQVAIKLLPPVLALDSQMRARFLREARTAASLSHPHIVPIHAVEEHGTLAFFSMSFIAGETLAERVTRTGPLSTQDALRVFREVAWALALAHDRGVIHRDIKPENILLERETGRSMVTDFGIARTASLPTLGAPGEVVGTPLFMSPEQALGAPVDGRSDLYALGATMFFALSGRTPFQADTIEAALASQLTVGAPPIAPIRPDVTSALAEAVDRCLAKDPEARFPSAAALAEALGAAHEVGGSVPRRLIEYREATENTAVDLVGYGTLVCVLLLAKDVDDLFGMQAFARRSMIVMAGSLMAVTLVQLLLRARGLQQDGYSWVESRGVFSPRDARRGITSLHADRWGGRPASRLRRVRDWVEPVMLGLGVVWMVAYWWLGGEDLVSRLVPSLHWAFQILGILLPLAIGRMLAAQLLIRQSVRALWYRICSGRSGQALFTAAGAGLRHPERLAATGGGPTAVVLGSAATAVYEALPTTWRERLSSVPETVRALEETAEVLRAREAKLARARALVGGRASAHPVAGGESPRAKARAELDEASRLLGERLAQVISALDNIRVDLVRLHAGVATPDDVSDALRAAEDVSIDISQLLAGEREVSELLDS